MSEFNSLDIFGSLISIKLYKSINSWLHHPELYKLSQKILKQTQLRGFLDVIAEAMLAEYLLSRDCHLQVEEVNPDGYGADFKVTKNGIIFYLHIKRFEMIRPQDRFLTLPSSIRILEKIRRSFVVQVRWHPHLDEKNISNFIHQAEVFLQRAHLGDEMVYRNKDGLNLAGVRVVSPTKDPRVVLIPTSFEGFHDSASRIKKLLDRSKRQFMPGEINVSVVAMPDDDLSREFEAALLGTVVERWDRHPLGKSRTAYGRSNDGFWSPGHHQDSSVCGWFKFDPLSASALNCYGVMSFDEPLDDLYWNLLKSALFVNGKIARSGTEA